MDWQQEELLEARKEIKGEKLLSEKRRTDGIEMLLKIKSLKEEVVYLKELNNGLDYCCEKAEQKLEKIEPLTRQLYPTDIRKKVKEILESK